MGKGKGSFSGFFTFFCFGDRNMAKPRRSVAPAPGAVVPLRMESAPKDGTPLIVRFLGPVSGILVHWRKKEPLACPGAESCPTANHRLQTRWKGYSAAEWWCAGQYQDWAPCVFEITEHLWDLLEGAELRGTVWRIQRQLNADAQKEVHGEQIGEVNEDYLRPAFSVEGVVQKVFKTPWIKFDVPRLFERRLLLPASSGAPPQILGLDTAKMAATNSSPYDTIRRKVLDGSLDEETRKHFPRIVAEIVAELAAKNTTAPTHANEAVEAKTQARVACSPNQKVPRPPAGH